MKQQTTWLKCRNPIIYIPILLLSVFLYLLNTFELDYFYFNDLKTDIKVIVKNVDNAFFIKTVGCRIPYLQPFDTNIKKYIFKVKNFKCSDHQPLVKSNLNNLYIEQKLLTLYNVSNITDIDCCYQSFWRINPESNKQDNLVEFDNNCTNFSLNTTISDEFVRVICKVNETEIYKDFHGFVPIKKKTKKSNNNLNILIIGIDSISRLNLERQMPITRKYFLEKMRGIEMIGYNKIGDNTFPNLIAILTGLTEDELTLNCWKTLTTKFDNCPFIWKNFSDAGFLTSYAEDATWMGLFNYLKRGFTEQPTDYYWRTFDYIAEKEIGHIKPYNAHLCIGPRPTYLVLLEYIKKFTLSLKNEKYFGFFWGSSLSHDNLNYPSLGDTNYEQFFKHLQKNNVFNNTVVIFLSDHGIRWGDIRSTHQGNLEERLPFLFFSFPIWFQKKYPLAIANLKRNSKKLTTPYDLHETLKDFINIENLSTDLIKKKDIDLIDNVNRGISLFLTIPENRTCESANISTHWCTCQKSIEIEKNDTIVINAANFIINYINKQLNGYRSCSPLQLNSILDSRLQSSQDYVKNNQTINDYTLIIKTEPGGALFESTVRCVKCNLKNVNFQMTGSVSRLNMYANQSYCVTDFHLKLYCYCIS